jgi:hypothetical protein
MGNRHRARRVLQRLELEEAWRRVKTEPRTLESEVRIPSAIGVRRLQVAHLPSFDPGSAWDVRELNGRWTLYGSSVIVTGTEHRLVGYQLLEIDGAKLSAFVDQARGLSLPVGPLINGMGGCDGTVYHLALFGDMFSEVRFQWWSDPPPQWRPLTALADKMIEVFSGCPKRAETQPPRQDPR